VEARVPLAAVAARCALAFPHSEEQLTAASPQGGGGAGGGGGGGAYTCMLQYDHERMTLSCLPPDAAAALEGGAA
jgi:hypothetical protein